MRAQSLLLATAGFLAFAVAAVAARSDGLGLIRLAFCGAVLGALVAIDVAEHRIPNRVVLPATAICAGLSLAGGAPLTVLAAALAVVALLLGISLAQPAALGMGDVKLALLITFGLDGSAPRALLIGLALAACAGLLLLLLRGRRAWRRAVPLAPFLASGALLALVL